MRATYSKNPDGSDEEPHLAVVDVHGEETHDDGLGEERDDKDGLLADAVRDGAVHEAPEEVEARVDEHNICATVKFVGDWCVRRSQNTSTRRKPTQARYKRMHTLPSR